MEILYLMFLSFSSLTLAVHWNCDLAHLCLPDLFSTLHSGTYMRGLTVASDCWRGVDIKEPTRETFMHTPSKQNFNAVSENQDNYVLFWSNNGRVDVDNADRIMLCGVLCKLNVWHSLFGPRGDMHASVLVTLTLDTFAMLTTLINPLWGSLWQKPGRTTFANCAAEVPKFALCQGALAPALIAI